MTPGPMGFREPIKITLRNQYEEDLLFWRSHQNPEKTVSFFLGDLFLEITDTKTRTKLRHFPVCFGIHKTEDP